VSTPSAEYQIVRRRAPAGEPPAALDVRLEYDPPGASELAGLTRRLGERFRERLGVAVRLELAARGTVPRFAYKAARVVDE
jgi:phenylacetate-coenzyme A ligase PaaK-like adenylate-forming protein